MYSPEELAQLQLNAYNDRNINEFARWFGPDITLLRLQTGEVFCTGREELIIRYGAMFAERTTLHCELVKRITCGAFCIDEEMVSGLSNDGTKVHATAIYETNGEYITRAWFIR